MTGISKLGILASTRVIGKRVTPHWQKGNASINSIVRDVRHETAFFFHFEMGFLENVYHILPRGRDFRKR